MGMNYSFFNEIENHELEDMFPDGLGWFSERVGASGDDSELKQLEKLLDVDLKLINHMEFDFEDDLCEIKTNVTEFELMVKELMNKIELHPDFHSKIHYQEQRPELCKQYLESGEIKQDLKDLLRIMNLYKSEGIVNFTISYF